MAGDVAFDFAADDFGDAAALGETIVRLGLLSLAPWVRPEDLGDARLLQSAIGACAKPALSSTPLPQRELETLNSFAADEPPGIRLMANGEIVRAATDPVRCALAAVARDAIEAIATARDDLRTCANPGCGAIFVDRSRAKRRVWCSMKRCGNRAKVARYRLQRHS